MHTIRWKGEGPRVRDVKVGQFFVVCEGTLAEQGVLVRAYTCNKDTFHIISLANPAIVWTSAADANYLDYKCKVFPVGTKLEITVGK